ncbi:hypothetical protein SRHO_G00054540 [Serrasalmus rhombeus]
MWREVCDQQFCLSVHGVHELLPLITVRAGIVIPCARGCLYWVRLISCKRCAQIACEAPLLVPAFQLPPRRKWSEAARRTRTAPDQLTMRSGR